MSNHVAHIARFGAARVALLVTLAVALDVAGSHGPVAARVAASDSPAITYSTFFASGFEDHASAVAADASGNVWVVGDTNGRDLPVRGGVGPTGFFSEDGFVAKFAPSVGGDASLVFSTYLGGSGDDAATSVAVDAEGNAYVTGFTLSPDFPATALGSPSARPDGVTGGGVFVVKFAPDGRVVYATEIGQGTGHGIAVDGAGSAYVTGITMSSSFPTVHPIQTRPDDAVYEDGFVSKLSPDGAALEYSTFVRGSEYDRGLRIAVDGDGNAYAAFATASVDFPVTKAFVPFEPVVPNGNLVIVKIMAGGTGFAYADLFGRPGPGPIENLGLAVTPDGELVVAGDASEPTFPVVGSAQAHLFDNDVFVSKIDASGRNLVFSVLLGSDGGDDIGGVALDSNGDVVVVGTIGSATFPTADGLLPFHPGQPTAFLYEGFVTKLRSDGRATLFSTFLGGTDRDLPSSVALGPDGTAYVTGSTQSADYPLVDAYQSSIPRVDTLHGFLTAISTRTDVPPPLVEGAAIVKSGDVKGRLRVTGENLQRGLVVFVGDDTTPWPDAKRTKKGVLLGPPQSVKTRFPAGVVVSIRIVNPDGGSATFPFERQQ